MGDEAVIGTALGPWRLRWTQAGLCGFRPAPGAVIGMPTSAPGWVREAAATLERHLEGEPQDLSGLPLDLSGLPLDLSGLPLDLSGFSPFQRVVADALRRTRCGTITYGDLAALAGRPGAARAVGRAVRDNPLLILIPCHRVVGAKDGGGWSAFGSPEVKARLMELEHL